MTLEPLAGLRVVDLFAGSGALGLEALSRGATHVDFVEAARGAREALERNVAGLELGASVRVWSLKLPAGLARLAQPLESADLVLVDPPYGGALARATLEALGSGGRLREGARVVLERHQKDEVPATSGTLELERERRYGETTVNFYTVRIGTAAEGRA